MTFRGLAVAPFNIVKAHQRRSWLSKLFCTVVAQQHFCAPSDADFAIADRNGYTCPECGCTVQPTDVTR